MDKQPGRVREAFELVFGMNARPIDFEQAAVLLNNPSLWQCPIALAFLSIVSERRYMVVTAKHWRQRAYEAGLVAIAEELVRDEEKQTDAFTTGTILFLAARLVLQRKQFPYNKEQGRSFLRRACALNHAGALNHVAASMKSEKWNKKIRNFTRAARMGFVLAQQNLADCLREKFPDSTQAALWVQRALLQGEDGMARLCSVEFHSGRSQLTEQEVARFGDKPAEDVCTPKPHSEFI
eukprot:c13850_g1_i2.p2 GENE.c13850_g1_i2~~c13850_g1_i2.p2  ORF type:complete len:237 (+),score=49.72 c13850_g1_i2:216-926(+)